MSNKSDGQERGKPFEAFPFQRVDRLREHHNRYQRRFRRTTEPRRGRRSTTTGFSSPPDFSRWPLFRWPVDRSSVSGRRQETSGREKNCLSEDSERERKERRGAAWRGAARSAGQSGKDVSRRKFGSIATRATRSTGLPRLRIERVPGTLRRKRNLLDNDSAHRMSPCYDTVGIVSDRKRTTVRAKY